MYWNAFYLSERSVPSDADHCVAAPSLPPTQILISKCNWKKKSTSLLWAKQILISVFPTCGPALSPSVESEFSQQHLQRSVCWHCLDLTLLTKQHVRGCGVPVLGWEGCVPVSVWACLIYVIHVTAFVNQCNASKNKINFIWKDIFKVSSAGAKRVPVILPVESCTSPSITRCKTMWRFSRLPSSVLTQFSHFWSLQFLLYSKIY